MSSRIRRNKNRKENRNKQPTKHLKSCIKVYRGTHLYREIELWRETDGYVMSEAARDGYSARAFDGADFESAWRAAIVDSNVAFAKAVSTWYGVESFCRAHSLWGGELSSLIGGRPMISWTTDLAMAQRFAGHDGYVLTATVPLTSILTRGTNEESEVLLANGVWATLYSAPACRDSIAKLRWWRVYREWRRRLRRIARPPRHVG
jgi:hypothetical protein